MRGPSSCHPLADPFTQHLIAVQVHNQKGPLTSLPCLKKPFDQAVKGARKEIKQSHATKLPETPKLELPLLYTTFSRSGTLRQ